MPVFSLVSRRAIAFGALCFAVLGLLLTLSTDRASAAINDDDDTEFVTDSDRDWVFADDPVGSDDDGGSSWSAPTYESAGNWLGYARGFAPSSFSGSPASTSTGPAAVGANDPAPGARSQSGDASWYSTTPGACAHRTVPAGSTITVTNARNGKSTTCTVEGWGPEDRTRVIDLSEETFTAIADPDVGVIPVHLAW